MKQLTFSLRGLLFAVLGTAAAALFLSGAERQKHARSDMRIATKSLGGRITIWRDDAGFHRLLPIAWRPNLCNVKLKNCNVEAAFLEKIDALGCRVIALDLTGTTVGDADIAKLQTLGSFAYLRDLGLARTKVTLQSVRRFEAARPDCVVHGDRSKFKTAS